MGQSTQFSSAVKAALNRETWTRPVLDGRPGPELLVLGANAPVQTKEEANALIRAIFGTTQLTPALVSIRDFALAQVGENTTPAGFAQLVLKALSNRSSSGTNQEETCELLAKYFQHQSETLASNRAYSIANRENPNAVWWPVPNHARYPRKAEDELPWARRYPIVSRDTRIGSAGSCFAEEIAYRLQRKGYNYVVTEPNPSPKNGLHRSCTGWGPIFNIPAFRQLIERSFGLRDVPPIVYWDHSLSPPAVRDPWRDEISFPSLAHYQEEYYRHQAAAREALSTVEVFVMTLGLNEVWELKEDNSVLSRNPRCLDPSLIRHRCLTFAENLAEMNRMREIWKTFNPGVKLIVSVSPIPLVASVQGDSQHVIAATCEAKSILRAVAGEFSRQHEDVYYMPSYDLISYCIPHPWTEDGRHVTRPTVSRVMELFDQIFVAEEGGKSS